MKILVLGGCGIQGQAAVLDLAKSTKVTEVICADASLEGIRSISEYIDMDKVRTVSLDAGDPESLDRLFRQADVAVDLLPRQFLETVCRAAIRSGVSVVNTNYAYPIAHLHEDARKAGVSIMPECGLDPGIDLVLYG